ncbi:nicotinate-nucleotide--dimethylbenzimidazole phosphoribosyltransferase [Streptomyces sp. NPDC014864]|uniref:nicotinate-nucleotide--dimethylbenzimidazole phosphoribosyltransferase n=1 Tax=Streptomyces sp. NPDC014864 TaxID=3364924 RepID=UPI0036F759AC
MTDTGQVPAEGLPESAGMVEQPGVPTHGASYAYLSETPAEDEDLLLPGSHGAWGNEVPPPAPEPVFEAVHEPGPHELSGRDSGSVDLGGVLHPNPAYASPAAPAAPRRPLHLGPPIPDTSASPVRSLADRGPAGAPVRPGPATIGPEHLDAQQPRESTPQGAAPRGAHVPTRGAAPAPAGAQVPAAETVIPEGGAEPGGPAEATLARLATQTSATGPAPVDTAATAYDPETGAPVTPGADGGAQVVQGGDGAHPVSGADGVQAVPGTDGAASAVPGVDGAFTVPGVDGGAAVPGAVGDARTEPGVGDGAHGVPVADGGAQVLPGADGAEPVAPGADAAATVSGADGAATLAPGADGAQLAGPGRGPEVGLAPADAHASPSGQEPEGGDAVPGGQEPAAGPAPESVDAATAGGAPAADADVTSDGTQAVHAGPVPDTLAPGTETGQVPAAAPTPDGAVPDGTSETGAAPAAANAESAGADPAEIPAAAEAGPSPDAVPADSGQAPDAATAAPDAEQGQVPDQAAAGPEQPLDPAAAESGQAPEAVHAAQIPRDHEAASAAEGAQDTQGAQGPQATTGAADSGTAQAPAPVADAPADTPVPAAADADPARTPAEGTAIPAAGVPGPLDAQGPQQSADAGPGTHEPQPAQALPAEQPQGADAAVPAAHLADAAVPGEDPAALPEPGPHLPHFSQQSALEAAIARDAAKAADHTSSPGRAQAAGQPQSAPPAEAGEAVATHSAVPGGQDQDALTDAQQAVAAAPGDPAGLQAAPPARLTEPGTAEPGIAEPGTVDPAGPTVAADGVPASAPAAQGPEEPSHAEDPGQSAPLPSGVPLQAQPGRPMGRFVPVEGSVPTTPHLAPAPPHPLVVPAEQLAGQAAQSPEGPAEPVVPLPAPRGADTAPAAPGGEPPIEVVQHADDLDTQVADQEESMAAVAEERQSTGPAAPGYDDAEREAVLKVMRERRDIRNGFRSDPIPHEVLLRVLEAAHTAPSVGHSQPWDFVVIRSADTRRAMHELAMRQREAYAKSLPKGRAKQFKELKIEAILDTPVNIVVTADPTRGGRHTLGRHTQPQMAPYSAALAVENLWLAARAEGLGVGWVSFFDEREMVRDLGLPEHLEVIAYLCVGYVDEFPDEPELMQAGWSRRRPLSWVVHEETYGRRALPGEDPHDLLAETVSQIRPLDAKALGEAWERQKRMTKPAGALGMLEIISAQLSGLSRQCPPPIPEPAAVAIFAGDHGVHAQGVTPWPQEVTAQMVANFLGGGAVCNAFAGQVGAEVCVVDVGVAADLPATPGLLPRKVRAGTSDMTAGPAMTREEAKKAIEVGIETARDLVAAGNKALLTGEMGIANTTASAALISVFTGADPAEVTGRGTGINDETLARKTEVVRRALELHQPDASDPIGVLAALGGFEHAAMVGLLLGGASLRTPVILDGVSAGAAALVARAIAPEVLAACIAGHRSAEPGHVAALNKLGLRPLVDLDLRLGEGTGALLALPLVQSTARAMHEVATFDSAGVTEK